MRGGLIMEARMAAKKKKGLVGIIGLGIMGGAFAQNLVKAGWHVIGYDTDAKRRRALARHGVNTVKTAADVAARAAPIIPSLPHPDALTETVRGIVTGAS